VGYTSHDIELCPVHENSLHLTSAHNLQSSPTNPTLLQQFTRAQHESIGSFPIFAMKHIIAPFSALSSEKGYHRGFSILPCLQSTDSSSNPPYCSVRSEHKHVQKQHSSIDEVASGSKLRNIYNSANGQYDFAHLGVSIDP
jgi:hypothetical protein